MRTPSFKYITSQLVSLTGYDPSLHRLGVPNANIRVIHDESGERSGVHEVRL